MKKKQTLKQKKANPKSKYWKTKADDLWREVIRAIYPVCAVDDNCSGNLEMHHLISRSNVATRHNVENGIGLCSKHHKFCPKLSAHKAPLAFAEWLEENDPDKWEWCSKNKWKVAKPDYEKAYGLLLEHCIENHIDV